MCWQRHGAHLLRRFRFPTKRRIPITQLAGGRTITHGPCKMTDQVKYLDTPDKSETDKKLYKTLLLGNGLHALIVSDPTPMPHDGFTTSESSSGKSVECESISSTETSSSDSSITSSSDSGSSAESGSEEGDEKLAACALMIDYGSFGEPEKYQGLAHFLEHMIFMGSEKYPEENIFDAHIKKCGGFSNANTDCEETLFYFEVAEKHLESSLDYFTALMKAPLMKQEAMQRERSAVDSEFQQIAQDDETRRDQLLASLATKGFPHGTFAWGNMKSLKENVDDGELHKVLHEIRKEHYGANRMYVCLQARLPIEELESLVVRHFAEIPHNDVQSPDLSQFNYRNAFRPEFHEQAFFVKPVENECKLELTWVLPNVRQYYRSKPDQFLSYLLGYEGRGSLCAYLRRRLWALHLIAGIEENGFDTNTMYALFNVCIYLTDEGFKNLDDVLAATFAYVKLFADCGSMKEVYEEQQRIEDTGFRFQAQRPAFDNVQELVLNTKHFPPKDILTGKELYYEYNEEHLKELVGHLNEMKFNLMVTSRNKYEGISTYDQTEEWFGTEYATIPMPEKWRKLWEDSKPLPELSLPEPNKFVTDDFTLFWHSACKPELPAAPKKLLKTDTCELWFRQDDKFELPEAHMYFYFISPLQRQSPKKDAMCTLYEELVKFHVCEELYPAISAGLSYTFNTFEKGLLLKVSGYNEKLHLIVEAIAEGMLHVADTLDEKMLAAFRKNLRKTIFNNLIKPKSLNRDVRLCVLEQIRWLSIDKYKCLNDITLEDLREFSRQFPKELYIQALIQGNYTEESAHNVLNSVLSRLNCQAIKEQRYVQDRTIQLPLGTNVIRCYALNEQDTNTVITNFYQIGPNSVRVESILDLMMMFVDEPLFDQLRTKEQLGYHVGATVRINYGIAGYTIMVNSQETKTTANYVEGRIEVFRAKMLQILRQMPQDEYEHNRDSLIKLKLVADMALSSEMARNWDEIINEDYLFDRRRRQIEILHTLQKSDIINFLMEIDLKNLRKLSVQVIGHRPADMPEPLPGSHLVSDDEDKAEDANEAEEDESETEKDDQEDEEEVDSSEEADDEDLFLTLENKLNVVFLPPVGNENAILDINEFKKGLDVYPKRQSQYEKEDPSRADRIEDALAEA
ncbi:nardilysin [Drosophila rhopaloa]|uniref:Nardilysin n=1 Tax=Drosophila rhopaloa TaxID=1041015 RepID=A0A6P4FJJ4_DRORH|nr:nardilysin [Drosophila rhopaloa]